MIAVVHPPAGFPDTIVVRGETWSVVYPDRIGKRSKKRVQLGRTTPWKHLIEVRRKQTRAAMRTTLLHELFHATQHCAPFTQLDSEDLCTYVGGFVADLARENDISWLKD